MKKALQFNLQGKFIKEFNSSSEAAKYHNAKRQAISLSCKNWERTCMNYFFRYKEDIPDDIYKIIINDKCNKRIEEYRIPLKLMSTKQYKKNLILNRSVIQYDIHGKFVQEFISIEAAIKSIDGKLKGLLNCIYGKCKTYKGFQWRFKELNENEKVQINSVAPIIKKIRPIVQFDKHSHFIREFQSIMDAAIFMNTEPGTIHQCLRRLIKTHMGFQWFFKDKVTIDGRIQPIPKVKNKTKIVKQYDLDGNFIKKYNSREDAARAINKTPDYITRVASGLVRHSEYIWEIYWED